MDANVQVSDHQILKEDVRQAVHEFTQVLSEMPSFRAWEEAAWALRQDQAAQTLYQQLAALDRQLRPLMMLGAADLAQRQQLEQLRGAYLELPVVTAYARAEAELRTLCQEANAAISAAAGLDWTAWCGSGCCG